MESSNSTSVLVAESLSPQGVADIYAPVVIHHKSFVDIAQETAPQMFDLNDNSSTQPQMMIDPNQSDGDNEKLFDKGIFSDDDSDGEAAASLKDIVATISDSAAVAAAAVRDTAMDLDEVSIDFSGVTLDRDEDDEIVAHLTQHSNIDHEQAVMSDADSVSSLGSNSSSSSSAGAQRIRHSKSTDKKTRRNGANKAAADAARLAVVESEIQAVKAIEEGPSAAEMRRRQLIEIDQEVLEERIEKLNKATLAVISKALGLSRQQRQQALYECRTFLKQHVVTDNSNDSNDDENNDKENDKDDSLSQFLEEAIEKHTLRIYGANEAEAVDALAYLQQQEYSDDEDDDDDDNYDEEDADKSAVVVASADAVVSADAKVEEEENDGEGEEMIALSDSEDENETPATESAVATSATVVGTSKKEDTFRLVYEQRQQQEQQQREQRRRRFLQARRPAQSSRAALLMQLRQKVHKTAKENYCAQRKIRSDQLELRLQISDKCRLLVELLKERDDRRSSKEREARRIRFQRAADEDEDEFDEDGGLGEGQFLRAQDREALQRMNADSDPDSDYEDNDNDDGDDGSVNNSDKDDDGDEDNSVTLRREEEGKNNAIPAFDDMQQQSSDADATADASDTVAAAPIDTAGNGIDDGNDDDDDDDALVAKAFGLRSKGRSGSRGIAVEEDEDGDDDIPTAATAAVESAVGVESAPLLQYGRKLHRTIDAPIDESDSTAPGASDATSVGDEVATVAVTSVAIDVGADAVEDLSAADEQQQQQRKVSKKPKTGNALWRLQLEEEERRSRNKTSNGLFDDEAEEEEEEGYQAGLGDFGFSTNKNVRDRDEEKDALRLRKGDLDHIVDDLSDDEGDESAGDIARAAMELEADRQQTRNIITAVTEGHDAMRKRLQQQRKGKFAFNRLVGEGLLDELRGQRRNGAAAAGGEGQQYAGEEEQEELDEEEMLQQGFKDRFEREQQAKAKKGNFGSDDSDSEVESDGEENTLEQLDTTNMTEEEKREEIDRIRQLQERHHQDLMRSKQIKQRYQRRRALNDHEKYRRRLQSQQQLEQLQSQQPQQQQLQQQQQPRLLLSRSLTLEPLLDEYSHTFARSVTDVAVAATVGVDDVAAMSNITATDFELRSAVVGAALSPSKRRKSAHPQRVAPRAADATRRVHRQRSLTSATVATAGASATAAAKYNGALDQREVLEGMGMGMAVAHNSRSSSSAATGGFFSTVMSGKRFGELSGGNNSNGCGAKRTFSGSVKRTKTYSGFGSTVSGQQFVFTGASSSSALSCATTAEESQPMASRSSSYVPNTAAATAAATLQRQNSEGSTTGTSSLFAQLKNARNVGASLNRTRSIPSH